MKATIVMPMRNAAATVRQSVESVLNSTHTDLEVLVIDDRSTDGGVELVRSIGDARVRLLVNGGEGQSDALNTGIAASTGDLFMRCDADDCYDPDRIAWQVQWLREHPQYGAVCGYASAMLHNGKPLAPLKGRLMDGHDVAHDLREGSMCSHLGAYAIRIEAARKIGFRPFFRFSQDYDFLFRLAASYEIGYCRRPAYTIRLTRGSVTHSTPLAIRRWYLECAQAFRQQRQQMGADALDRGECPQPPAELWDDTEVEHVQEAAISLLTGAAWASLADGERTAAIAFAARAAAMAPARAKLWRNLVVVGVKSALS